VTASVVLDNLIYLIGAVVLAVVLGLVVAMRHRRPSSVEATVNSFSRGLRALSPDATPARGRRRPGAAAPSPQSPTRPAVARTVLPEGRTVGGAEPHTPTGGATIRPQQGRIVPRRDGPAPTHPTDHDTEAETG